jgi:hypothetical protein
MKRNFCYIELTVKSPLKRSQAIEWLNIVRANGPSGIVAQVAVSTAKKTGSYSSVHVTTRSKKHKYIVALCRDLTALEAQKIVLAWHRVWPKGDFEVDFSQLETAYSAAQQKNQETQQQLTMEAAKLYHTAWYRKQTAAGWRYAAKLSMREHTHPMLLPWDQLAEKYQQQSLDTVQCVMDALHNMGLQLTEK